MGLWDDPEVEKLLDDPAISEVVKANDLAKLEALLRSRLKTATDPAQRATLEKLLANRRLFIKKIDRAPSMTTVRGIGMLLYGSSDREPDGSYISTLFFVFLFLPIFPVAQYVVRNNGGGSYTFFGQVPLSQLHVWWRRLLAIVVAGGAIAVFGGITYARRFSQVHVVNALDVPVAVTIGKTTVRVPTQGESPLKLERGRYHVSVALDGGRVIEETDVEVPGNTDFVAYNVLGAAPLYAEEVVYTADSATTVKDDAEHELYAGKSLVSRDKVEYVLVAPPQTIQMSEGSSVTRRWHVGIEGGWTIGVAFLAATGHEPDALRVARAVSLAEPTNESAIQFTMHLASDLEGDEAALAHARRVAELAVDAVEPHRALQTKLEDIGRIDEVRAQYEKDAADHPDSPVKQYLALRIAPLSRQLAAYPGLASAHPKDKFIQIGNAYALHQAKRFEEAVAAWKRVGEVDAESAAFASSQQALALTALGRIDEAVSELAVRCGDPKVDIDLDFAVLYARLSKQLVAKTDPTRCSKRLGGGHPADATELAMLAAGSGDVPADLAKVTPDHVRRGIEITLATSSDPETAFRIASVAEPETLRAVSDTALVLLALERKRLGDDPGAKKLLDAVSARVNCRRALEELVLEGSTKGDLDYLPFELQAALAFGKLRAATTATKRQRDDMIATIRELDLTKGIVTTALAKWPALDGENDRKK